MNLAIKYLTDSAGKKTAVQIPISDWNIFFEEHQRLLDFKKMKVDLTEAVSEIDLIEKGKKKPRTLKRFLNGL